MEIINNVPFEFWWKVAKSCPYATFFHSPLWHKLIEETYEDKVSSPIGAIADNGTKLVIPLLVTGQSVKGIFKDYVSSFAGCYGGIIADGPVEKEMGQKLYTRLCGGRTGSLQLNGNPLWKEYSGFKWPNYFDDDQVKDDFTHILSLDKSMEEIVSNFSQGHRTSMRKGKKMGVTIKAANSLDDYKSYFGAYEDSLKRWGDDATSVYPWQLFENGYKLQQQYSQHIKLWLAEVEEQVVAGAWTFYWNDHIDWWHGAAYKDFFDHYPNNVLLPSIFKDGIRNDYKYFDFNPSGGHEGVEKFKKRFGAEKWQISRLKIEGGSKKLVEKFKKRWSF